MHQIGATVRDSSKTITGTHILQNIFVNFLDSEMSEQLNII